MISQHIKWAVEKAAPLVLKTQASSVRSSWRDPLGLVAPFPEVDIPLDVVAVVFLGQSPMERYVLLEVAEVGFQRIGGLWDTRVVEEAEHVGQGPSDLHVGFADHLVGEPLGLRRLDDGLVVAVEHEAQLVGEPCVVYQQVDPLVEPDSPDGTAVEVLVELSGQLPRTVSTQRG